MEYKRLGGGNLGRFLLRKELMLQEHIEELERAPDVDSSR